MQSRIFLGPNADPPRRYAFTHRDRHDEVVQRVRSVRSSRYRYIRNYIPERPFLFYHAHQHAMYPVVSLLRRLHEEGKLNAIQEQLLAPRLPEEELYDLKNDPHEISNLAGSEDPWGYPPKELKRPYVYGAPCWPLPERSAPRPQRR